MHSESSSSNYSRFALWLVAFVVAATSFVDIASAQPTERVVAADVSSLSRVIDSGGAFTTFRGEAPLLEAMKDAGFNTVRLRLWVDPADGYSDLNDVVEIAGVAHAAGLDVWLNIHYSDLWADPGTQTKPAAWQTLTFPELVQHVRQYTRDTVSTFEFAGIPLALVQIGNEVQDGMLWPDGQISVSGYTPLVTLLESCIAGLRDADLSRQPYVIIHSGGPAPASFFFDELESRDVEYDIAAISYYPYFHGTLSDFEHGLAQLVATSDKQIMIAEIGYPWTFEFGDGQNNIVGDTSVPADVLAAYPANPAGQAAYVEEIWDTVISLPENRGLGVAYWEPAWLPGVVGGSALENLALFDFGGGALPAFYKFGTAASPVDGFGIGVDPVYAPPVAVQTLQPARPLVRQLDALFVSQVSGGLLIGIPGNIEADAGSLFLFIDTDAGSGMETLSMPHGLQNGWSALDGLDFDDTFAPELAVAITLADESLFADLFDLSGASATFSYLGTAPVDGGKQPLLYGANPAGIEAAYCSLNSAGIGAACGRPLSATDGLEVFLPRSVLAEGLSSVSRVGLGVCYITREGNASLQWLPALPESVVGPLDVSGLDLGQIPGEQHVWASLASDPRRPVQRAIADLNGDGATDEHDIAILISELGDGRRSGDVNADGILDFFDVVMLLRLIDDHCD
ncbi:MAG: glycosyl hydrolase 53 family protein [Planctomycetota bacterium]